MNRLARPLLLVATLGAASAAAQAQSLMPFMQTADGAISARFDGARCGDSVRMIFNGRNAEVFRNGPDTARLMNNVTYLLRQQCPALVRVTARGMADSKIVYSGLAEAATNWEVVELGSGSGSGLLAAGQGTAAAPAGGPSARDLFGRDSSFVAAPKVLEWARVTPNFCIRHEAKDNSCAALNELQPQSDGTVRIQAQYKLDATGAVAELAYPAQNKAGFFCANPETAKVVVTGGKLSAAGRTDMQSLLLERVQSAGTEVCTGYAGTSAQALNTESFNAAGVSQTPRTPVILVSQRPPLRLDR